MNNHSQLKSLLSYKAWADSILYDALSDLPQGQLTVERPMLFGSILKLLNHVYAMDCAWRHNLQRTPHGLNTRNPVSVPQFGDLKNDQADINQWYIEHVERLSSEMLSEIVSFTFIGGERGRIKQSDVLHHIVNHSTYHRGHIEGVLYQLSITPPTTDIPVFIREKNAEY